MKICVKCGCEIARTRWHCDACGWMPQSREGFVLLAPELLTRDDFYPETAHDQLIAVEDQSFWFLNRNDLICEMITKYFPNAGSMMEIGCGNGFVLAGLAEKRPEMELFGAEAFLSGLKHAKKRLPDREFAQMDARKIPFVEEFDLVGAFDVIEHIPEDELVLKEIYKSLKPDGGAIITVPQHPWLWSNTDERAGHKRRYTKKELVNKLEQAGFKIVFSSSFITLLFPFMLASRFLGFTKKSENKPQYGLRPPFLVTAMFQKICKGERRLINKLSLPFGGSLLCLGIKPGEKRST